MQSTIYKDVDKAVSNDSTPHTQPEVDSRLGWGEEASRVYESTKERLLSTIGSTKSLLSDIQNFNSSAWTMHYPGIDCEQPQISSNSLHRTLSADGTTGLSTNDQQIVANPPEMQVLRLDLKLGASSAHPSALVNSLEKSSIATLLDSRLTKSSQHLEALSTRIKDTSSKVLVTGDLNSGKSTFVNAILRRNVMPSNQLPTTTLFCEVHPVEEHPEKIEQVHLIKSVRDAYSPHDESTFKPYALEDLEILCEENETNPNPPLLKVYLNDPRSANNSLLSNGTVSISLIDAPGLNLDTLSTTALFARQEEIDVIVFVLSAENRLTLSAKEFLVNASHEKACVFCVVNGWDRISEKNKEKCKKGVLDQLKSISHETWMDREELVHFVDSTSVETDQDMDNSSRFARLEESLRNFVLFNRQKSKLAPAARFLSHLLSDVELLSKANVKVADEELEAAKNELIRVKPILEQMREKRESLQNELEKIENDAVEKLGKYTRKEIENALNEIGNGRLASDKVSMPVYQGLLSIYPYARAVKHALLESLDITIKDVENQVRDVTGDSVTLVQTVGNEALPEGVERVKRIFVKEAMFKSRSKSVSTVGMNLSRKSQNIEISPREIFDTTQFLIFRKTGDKKIDEDEDEGSFLGGLSLAVGAITMVGGKTMGMRGFIEGAVRISNLWGSDRVRQWAAPAISVLVVGAATYYIFELPRMIPRTIGTSIKNSLEAAPEPSITGDHTTDNYSEIHQLRVERETRKVLRLASWDVKEKFRATLETHATECQRAEQGEAKAKRAIEWFENVCNKVEGLRKLGGLSIPMEKM
ncbi:hypothetical protein WALSEDRAFT_34123 [Wallemia mellicola CBS 633.66]|uniref:Dynamin-type G domain-containing protein n=2 Tax=Wallemia mellicola TaxID=1708541 RepID=I4Y5V9_WALMC|nr:hypothetical protein WALSEDRAFT_34123 [Wallemia mellicola CBS 633.66]TIB67133.1 hypothetical protein E3Q24_04254 [Wallemia mellicola]EIM19351.1 hypothetical protein WALSEDRAFT_34123 [Wallemia mellicola CBS 633.66]TIB98464.1 hypothetical protein E3Q16_04313 [Wallemia mellicola]TIC06817.1 hypothetical protein E3Q15_04336 [Wallemia mellicola]TIC11579.1 hypothetical protein E3Q13_04368 [Wallemia mellicola]|eukprot:XP_006960627.1 hypothetical protein WALSEDRAFT_34123 [Wallemia mellicola CBS 633.66]